MAIDPKKVVSFQEGKELFDNYSKGNYPLINANRKKADSRSYWFSIQELEDYLAFLKKEMGNLDTQKMGIRIYLGTYGEGSEVDGQDVSGYQTIFLYPEEKATFHFQETSEKSEGSDLGYNRTYLSPPM